MLQQRENNESYPEWQDIMTTKENRFSCFQNSLSLESWKQSSCVVPQPAAWTSSLLSNYRSILRLSGKVDFTSAFFNYLLYSKIMVWLCTFVWYFWCLCFSAQCFSIISKRQRKQPVNKITCNATPKNRSSTKSLSRGEKKKQLEMHARVLMEV